MKKFILLICIIFLTFNLFGYAGKSKFQFLKFSPSVKGSSIGDSACSIPLGIDSFYYNPAGSYSHNNFEIGGSYTIWFQNLIFLNLAGKIKFNEIGKIKLNEIWNTGIGIIALFYDDIFKVIEENGELVRTEERVYVGNFLITGNLSKKFGEKFYSGINLKIIGETLETTSIGIGIDLGSIYNITEKIGLGFSILNLGIFGLPLIIRSGANYKMDLNKNIPVWVSCEIDKMADSGIKAGLGIEILLLKIVTIRAGYRIGEDTGTLRIGTGLSYKRLSVDYCFTSHSELGNVHRIGLKYTSE